MMLIKVLADNQRRGHVEQTGADTIEQAVREEHPLESAHEWGA